MSSCVLYQNSTATITILDVPHSIELGQGSSQISRLVSNQPPENPYPSVEPKSAKAKAKIGDASLEDLLLQKHLQFALEEVKGLHVGSWCLPRVIAKHEGPQGQGERDLRIGKGRKRRRLGLKDVKISIEESKEGDEGVEENHAHLPDHGHCFHNSGQKPLTIQIGPRHEAIIPPKSTFLQGAIPQTVDLFGTNTPKFDIVVLDPPWPNRSAKRKKSYGISYSNFEIHSLLSSIPIYDRLASDSYVAIWVTNKPSFREMVTGEGGLFAEWGVKFVEEWVWLKVTCRGEPIYPLEASWRRPYELLLMGRRGQGSDGGDVKRRVIIAVPDLHSRKPNLKFLFERMMGKEDGYEGLEIFARNLTTGWWSWGDEVLKFQTSEHWMHSPS